MLVLSRKTGEVVTIGNDIKITVVNIDRGIVRLGIEAPKSVVVHRQEVYDKIIESNKEAASTEVSDFINLISDNRMNLAGDSSNTNDSANKANNIKIK